ncbi:FAD-binding oxidoreductase [Spongiactinospora gelatinilytica]|nr:FAD-binding oxidoreductase [Spongiactinospora gelatinilytica]
MGEWTDERAPDRRAMLRLAAQATVAGLGAGLLPGAAQAAESIPEAPQSPDERAWRELRGLLGEGGRLRRPGESGYLETALPKNRRYANVRPAGIVSCRSTQGVSVAVRWARKHSVSLVPRSGGHNYAGHSTTYGLLVDLSPMNSVRPRRTAGRPRLIVGGGATNSHVYQNQRYDLYFPGGRCPGVGVAGLTLGGGLGFNDRKWGMTCDLLTETELVLPDGTVVRASERENSDLLWACQGGGGGNFGINTEFTFGAVDVSRLVSTVFDLTFDAEHGVALLRSLREIIERDRRHDFDCRLQFSGANGRTGPQVNVLGHYLGRRAPLERLLAEVLALNPTRRFIDERGFWRSQEYLLAPAETTALVSKSLAPSGWPDDDAAEAIVDWTRRWRSRGPGNTGYVTLFAMGGATAEVAPRDTAFPHRNAKYIFDIGARWAQNASDYVIDQSLAAVTEMYDDLRRRAHTSAAYVNFPDPALRRWWDAYYGPNYHRLTKIKQQYDPTRFFRHAQSVGSALTVM